MDDLYKPSNKIVENAHINKSKYEEMYKESISNPIKFWNENGKRIDWIKNYEKVRDFSYDQKNLYIKWFEDGTLNASYNCIDRHLKNNGNKTAIIWEGDNPDEQKSITYNELYKNVCKFANVLKKLGAKKGDRITIYMPMIPEAAYAMLACTRIGAIHSVVFGGFSPEALAGRIEDCNSNLIITADEGIRGGKTIPLKQNTDEALKKASSCKKCLVIKRTNGDINWINNRDFWYHELFEEVAGTCEPEEMNAEDPMVIPVSYTHLRAHETQ